MIKQDLERFLLEWNSNSEFIKVQTSGSTGKPKEKLVRKQKMLNSAKMTCDFLNLKNGDKALLCMPLQYIAGKMMVVRSIYAHLELILKEPSGHPLADMQEGNIDFAAMIPLQIYNSLQIPKERDKLSKIKNIIIGGGFVDQQLENELKEFPNNIYSSYGMTETLSHIALRKISNPNSQERYYPLPDITVSLSKSDTLQIHAPSLCDEDLITNDMAEFNEDGSFIILGRKDNIINSGGIKIQIERLEHKLMPFISYPFAITSIKDVKFGEKVVLLLEKGSESSERSDKIKETLKGYLDKYEYPKYILEVDGIPLTSTGKINRAECKEIARIRIRN